jgi:type IV secretory pathway VirB10-like protein
MNVRWVVPVIALVAATATLAAAQTTTAPAAGVATFDQAPPAPPVPPAPPAPAAATAPQAPPAPPAQPPPPAAAIAPQAPRTPQPARVPRASTGEAPDPPEVMRRSRGQLVNLRLEFTVTDQIGTAPPVRKTITMNVADGESGRIRTNAEVYRKNAERTIVPLSVDASPEIDGNRIRLRASLEYQLLKDPEPDLPAGKTSITQSVTAILSDGVSTILSQSADPLTDRKVTLEVKATIIR